jgi:4'-phosphopantetheinyl transferase
VDAHELHVWTACPQDFDAEGIASLMPLLDDEERERCARFRFAQDRRAYIVSHAMRRAALSRVLGASPSTIGFHHDTQGKPVLSAPRADGIFFSHSRRRDTVAIAVTRLGPVGIDVESAEAQADGSELLDRHVRATDPRKFPLYWTALEAFWKAEGTGLDEDHQRIECSPDPSRAFPISFEGELAGPRAMARALTPPGGCVTTVAILGANEFNLTHHHCNSAREI